MIIETDHKTGDAVAANQSRIAEAVTAEHFALNPELEIKYGAAGRAKCRQDAAYHLQYLSESLYVSQPSLFADYAVWAKDMLAARGVPKNDLVDNFTVLRRMLAEVLPGEAGRIAGQYVDAGIERLSGNAADGQLASEAEQPLNDIAEEYLDALLGGRRDAASRLVLDTLESGATDIKDVYLYVFQKTQHEIGRLWQTNQISVAQEHYCTAATQMIMSQLYPRIFSTEKNGFRMVATCVSSDLHEIGVRVVSDFFEMEGWDTIYLGANTPAPALVQTLKETSADLVVISATMTYHISLVREMIEKIRADEQTRKIKVMVGGYPFNVAPELWRTVGADGFSFDAPGAVETAKKLMEEREATK